jgi:hypothetical protein
MADLYSSLDPGARQIRLLRTHRILGVEESPEKCKTWFPDCELSIFNLDRMPRYRALSYCWGLEEAGESFEFTQWMSVENSRWIAVDRSSESIEALSGKLEKASREQSSMS